jgi:hypothetical protein
MIFLINRVSFLFLENDFFILINLSLLMSLTGIIKFLLKLIYILYYITLKNLKYF